MPQEVYSGVPVVPGDPKQEETRPHFDQTPEQEERATYVSKRLRLMEQEKSKYIQSKRRALMLYDGIFRLDGDPAGAFKKEEIVAPLARIFVEAKTSEEVRAFSDFQFFPVDDEADAGRAELLMEAVDHVRRVTKARAKRHELLRMKNIIGISIKWKGFRETKIKMNVTKAVSENGVPTEWEEKDMPGESEIFEDIIDPFVFYVDPNASSMNDALDCAMYFRMNAEEIAEVFGNTDLYDIKGLGAGSDGMVEGLMYFKKPSGKPDMFCIYAWPSAGYGIAGMKPGHTKEVFYGGLLDEHKMLPFVSYHNVPTFTNGFFGEISRSSSGEPATSAGSIQAKQKFWAYAGDPEIIMDLIDLRTSFGRSMYKACALASRSLIATKGNFRIDTSKDWQHGEQIPDGMGKIEAITFGVANVAAFQTTLDDIYQLCIQATGIDPRNLADSKEKTATESIAQRETSMRRLEEGIAFNEENGEVRDGQITFKLIQQHYTTPKMVRLTGAETEEELKKFDEVEGEHPRTGKPLIGKQFRRIRTKKPFIEMSSGKQKRLRKEDYGTYSFIARPEYIRTSEMDIAVLTTRRAGEIQALKAAQMKEALELFVQLFPLTQPSPTGGAPLFKIDSLPPIETLIDAYMEALGIKGKKKVKGGTDEKTEAMQEAFKAHKANIKPLGQVPVEQV